MQRPPPPFTRRRLLAGLALAAATPSAARAAEGFAGLGAAAEGFATPRRGRALAFPADHGAHPDYRIEWWYLTANLEEVEGGAPLGLQWTLFRQALRAGGRGEGWGSGQLWLAHAAVTDAGAHRSAERLGRGGIGQAGVEADPFRAYLDHWALEAPRDAPSAAAHPARGLGRLALRAEAPGFAYALTLTTEAPPVLQGEAGYSVKSDSGQASYYYSQPFFAAEGAVTRDGRSVPVRGRAWLDREWSSQPLSADQEGWDWASLHLASGAKAMLFRLRHRDGRHFHAGNWITADGASSPIAREAITMTPRVWTEVAGRRLPTEWRLTLEAGPERRLDVVASALNPRSWMATGLPYWEGPIRLSEATGGGEAGVGYLEMTGYAPDRRE